MHILLRGSSCESVGQGRKRVDSGGIACTQSILSECQLFCRGIFVMSDGKTDLSKAVQWNKLTPAMKARVQLARLHANFQPEGAYASSLIPTLCDDILIETLAEPLADVPTCSTCIHWNPKKTNILDLSNGVGVCHLLTGVGEVTSSVAPIVLYSYRDTGTVTVGTRHDFCCSEWVGSTPGESE